MRRSKQLNEKIYEELAKTGLVSDACAKVGISRQTFYRWQRENAEFRQRTLEAIQLGNEFVTDMATSVLIRSIQANKLSSVRFWLLNMSNAYRRNAKGEKISEFNAGTPNDNNVLEIRIVNEKQVPDDPDNEEDELEATPSNA